MEVHPTDRSQGESTPDGLTFFKYTFIPLTNTMVPYVITHHDDLQGGGSTPSEAGFTNYTYPFTAMPTILSQVHLKFVLLWLGY